MPVILRPHVYETWLDPGNQKAVELVDLLKNEIITKMVSYTVSKRASSIRDIDSTCIEAVGKPQQTMLVWPEHKERSQKGWIAVKKLSR